jgi:hypothetical protein
MLALSGKLSYSASAAAALMSDIVNLFLASGTARSPVNIPV